MTHLPGLAAWLSYRMPAPPLVGGVGILRSVCVGGLGSPLCTAGRGRWRWRRVRFLWSWWPLHPFAPRLPRGVLQLTALDCGQGDALFLVLPGGTTMLLDAGGSRTRGAREGGFQGRRWDSGEDIVSPYLWSLGLKRIDVVALTHARPDQLGGLYAVLGKLSRGRVLARSRTRDSRVCGASGRRWRNAGFRLEPSWRAMRFPLAMRQFGCFGRDLTPAT